MEKYQFYLKAIEDYFYYFNTIEMCLDNFDPNMSLIPPNKETNQTNFFRQFLSLKNKYEEWKNLSEEELHEKFVKEINDIKDIYFDFLIDLAKKYGVDLTESELNDYLESKRDNFKRMHVINREAIALSFFELVVLLRSKGVNQ